MYRALGAHFALYLAFYKIYTEKFIEANLEIEKDLKEAVVDAITLVPDYSTDAKPLFEKIMRSFKRW